MSIVDEIEAELKQISPWPWRCSRVDMQSFNAFTGEQESFLYFPFETKRAAFTGQNCVEDARFASLSPERLAALCRYVRATEALIETWGPLDLAAMSPELQAARRELGLTGRE